MKTYVRGWMGKLDGTLRLGPCLPSLHLDLPHLLRLRCGSVIPAIVNTVPQIEPRKFSRNTCQSHLSSPRDLFAISGMMTAWNHRPIRTLNAVRNTSKQPQRLGEVQKEASKKLLLGTRRRSPTFLPAFGNPHRNSERATVAK